MNIIRSGELGMIRRYGLRRIWHLIRPGRREREIEAQRVVAAAARTLVEAPLGNGLSLRQISELPNDLRWDVWEGLIFGKLRLSEEELSRLCHHTDEVRVEYPQLFRPDAETSG